MVPPTDPADDRRTTELQNLLAVYLANAPSLRCPGCDGLLVEDVLPGYPSAASHGEVPGETDLCARHPDLTPQIVAFFFLLSVATDPHPNPPLSAADDGPDDGQPDLSSPACLE